MGARERRRANETWPRGVMRRGPEEPTRRSRKQRTQKDRRHDTRATIKSAKNSRGGVCYGQYDMCHFLLPGERVGRTWYFAIWNSGRRS